MTRKPLYCAWALVALLLIFPLSATAADSLSVDTASEGTAGSSHTVSWTYTGEKPACYDMRLYFDGKLIAKSMLDGGASSATISAGTLNRAGSYSVKVFAIEKNNSYIVSEVAFSLTGGSEDNTKPPVCEPEPTKKPGTCDPEPTIKPTPVATATAKPTAQMTAQPIATPTPTVKPTAKPTAAPTARPTSAPSGDNMTAMAEEVIRQTNSDRAKNGLGALTVDADLTRAACIRAQEIVSKFSHERPDGSNALSVSGKAKGENIAKGQQTADKVTAAWMSSDGHRANILRASFRTIGVCAYRVNGILYWVQLFGN